ncbi:MAG: hypothetical protein ACJAVX_003023 [Pseudoalteromonas rhizosphaerae]|jgi:hypothetical protein|uniref:hypothetical protein n=1 Tax=Pseudoalteromonas rhizosphaerae TaxID=2518973 RepID=UPI0039E41A86
MAAFTASQASITNGSKVVTINSGESIANVRQGDFLFLAGFLVEINRGYVGAASQQYIELVKNWANSSQSSQPAVVIPTTGDFRAAVDAINNANQNVNDNFVAMQDWQTKTGTVTFVNQDGTTTTVKTLKQIEADNAAQMDAYHPFPWAMRKVEFEARRAANNEKHAASGFVHKGKQYVLGGGYSVINEGLWTNETAPNVLRMGRDYDAVWVDGVSSKFFPEVNIAGVISELSGVYASRAVGVEIKFPPAEDGTRTYDSATGISVKHATPAIAFASETATNKVVTDRVDMWGFEFFLREINDADPFVYAKGLIQSLATSINGVATVSDNIRPITYFAWYEGDESSRGKGVNWQTASEAQRIVIASDPENNIYFDDATGKFYQWSPRGCSFSGISNGDWDALDSSRRANYLDFSISAPATHIRPQGNRDTRAGAGVGFPLYSSRKETVIHPVSSVENGIFGAMQSTSTPDNTSGVNGECYFLVCGTVNRLNQGAYHPSYNPLGSAGFVADNSGNPRTWSHSKIKESGLVVSKASCFDYGSTIGQVSYGTGSLSSGYGLYASGRSDGRFYDAIYASGAGGVCRDMRYSAWGLKAEDFAAADLAIKSGKYRGRERLGKTLIYEEVASTSSSTSVAVQASSNANILRYDVGDHLYLFDGSTGSVVLDAKITTKGSDYFNTNTTTTYNRVAGNTYYVVLTKPQSLSIAGEFNHTEVIGNPANILQCDDLKDGWVGSWNPNIPDGVERKTAWNRKYITIGKAIVTDNYGSSYSEGTPASWFGDSTNNSTASFAIPANRIVIANYLTNSKMSGDSVNAVVRSLGNVFVSSYNTLDSGSPLGYSLIDKVLTGLGGTPYIASLPLTQNNLQAGGKLPTSQSWSEISHSQIEIPKPSNSNLAFKALNYNVADNQQGFINYAYTELKHDGTDWGDDGKIHIADNQTTMLDENGNTVLVGTAQIVEPLGWIENDK